MKTQLSDTLYAELINSNPYNLIETYARYFKYQYDRLLCWFQPIKYTGNQKPPIRTGTEYFQSYYNFFSNRTFFRYNFLGTKVKVLL